MFTRENTKEVKGIAILLMLMYHLYYFTDRIPYGMDVATDIVVYGKELTKIMGAFGGLCVPLYMFLGGYGLYMRVGLKEGRNLENNSLMATYIRLYKAYWKVFLLFIPIGYLFFDKQPQYCENMSICNRFAECATQTILINFVGLSNSIVPEWWFLLAYLFALFLGVVFWEIFKKNSNLYVELISVLIWHILVNEIFVMLPWNAGYVELEANVWFNKLFMNGQFSVYLLVGIIFAKYQIFDAWKELIKGLGRVEKVIISAFVILIIVDLYVFLLPPEYMVALLPVFVFATVIFIDTTVCLKKILKTLGEHSTNMWLIHAFYCYYFYPFVKVVYGSKNAVVALVALVGLSLGSSYLVNYIWKYVGIVYNSIKKLAK